MNIGIQPLLDGYLHNNYFHFEASNSFYFLIQTL
jgi:hypothetical protein